MPRWVMRKGINGEQRSELFECHDAGAMIARPGRLTVEECVAVLLQEGESTSGEGAKLPVMRDETLVGYIEITQQWP